jgi:hypothetical protein
VVVAVGPLVGPSDWCGIGCGSESFSVQMCTIVVAAMGVAMGACSGCNIVYTLGSPMGAALGASVAATVGFQWVRYYQY